MLYWLCCRQIHNYKSFISFENWMVYVLSYLIFNLFVFTRPIILRLHENWFSPCPVSSIITFYSVLLFKKNCMLVLYDTFLIVIILGKHVIYTFVCKLWRNKSITHFSAFPWVLSYGQTIISSFYTKQKLWYWSQYL